MKTQIATVTADSRNQLSRLRPSVSDWEEHCWKFLYRIVNVREVFW